MPFPPCVLPSVPKGGKYILSPRLLRQLRGLTVRCERAMRAIAPGWQAQKASWGEAACLFERLASPSLWLCQSAAIMSEGEDGKSLLEPVIQLLASSVATVLKTARVTGINADHQLPCHFVVIPALLQSITDILPAAISLLLPRMAGASSVQGASPTLLCTTMNVDSAQVLSQWRGLDMCPVIVLGSCHMAALVSRVVAKLLHCSGPATTRHDSHYAVGRMSCYAACLSALIFDRANQGCEGAPSTPARICGLLAAPLLQLLHSPLLDTLVVLQHVMVTSLPMQKSWESFAADSICQIRLPSASMADAMGSKVAMAMQVGHTCYSGVMQVCHTFLI